jgi:GTPase Era involved in 16S rRNA processing/gas vesicle protein
MKLIETIEALANASNHLNYSRDVINRIEIKPELKDDLLNKLDLVYERLNDENLYVSVIGRANTGKTTLINALIESILLKSNHIQFTTAAATFLTYGREIGIRARFQEGLTSNVVSSSADNSVDLIEKEVLSEAIINRSSLIEYTKKDEPITIPAFSEVKNISIEDLIYTVTTSNNIAEKLLNLFVFYPSPFLQQGIIIIDAPGFDSVMEDTKEKNKTHDDAVKKAINKSDIVIFATPAERALTKDDIDSLGDSNYLKKIIHRCVFLVTRMDLAVSSERNKSRDEVIKMVYDNTLKRLEASLSKYDLPKKPILLFSSAQAVIDDISNDKQNVKDSEDHNYWISEFAKMREDLVKMMTFQRSSAITESVLRLLKDLFYSINVHIDNLWEDYEKRVSLLEDLVTDIDVFCENQRKKTKKRLNNAANEEIYKIELEIDKQRDKSIEQICNAIYESQDVSGLQAAAKDSTKSIVEKSKNKIEKAIKNSIQNISNSVELAQSEFDIEFNTLYEQLSSLGKDGYSDRSSKSSLSIDNNYNFSVSSSFEDNTSENIIGAAILGGIIGSIIPGIGTIVGGIVGGIVGSLFGPSLSDRKSEAWNAIRPKLVDYYTDIKQNAVSSIRDYGDSMKKNTLNRIDKHANTYRKDIENIRNAQVKERLALEALQVSLTKDKVEIEARQQKIANIQIK